jgi:hypothetical protein
VIVFIYSDIIMNIVIIFSNMKIVLILQKKKWSWQLEDIESASKLFFTDILACFTWRIMVVLLPLQTGCLSHINKTVFIKYIYLSVVWNSHFGIYLNQIQRLESASKLFFTDILACFTWRIMVVLLPLPHSPII